MCGWLFDAAAGRSGVSRAGGSTGASPDSRLSRLPHTDPQQRTEGLRLEKQGADRANKRAHLSGGRRHLQQRKCAARLERWMLSLLLFFSHRRWNAIISDAERSGALIKTNHTLCASPSR